MNFWHDTRTDMLVYDVPEPERIIQHVPEAIRLHNGYFAVPHTLWACQVLRAFDLPVPPPMSTYDWPIKNGLRPREHQKTMANFMVLHPRSFNLSDMGTMKTLATLWAADFIMRANPGWRTLIVCPLSIMQRVWADAIFTHLLGKRTCVIVHGSAEKRRELLARPADFYIINHDGVSIGAKVEKRSVKLSGLSHDIANRSDIAIVAVDEAAAYRAGNTRRHHVARAVLVPKPYLWPLTGTPTPNGPLDAHGLARLVNNAFGESFTSYKNRVMYLAGPWKWLPKQGAGAEARKLLSPAVRFEMRELNDIPPTTVQQRDVEFSDEQKALYKRLERDLVLTLESGAKITTAHEAALRLKLIQISCGALYDSDHNVTRLDCSPRLAVLREVIEEARRKLIVFAPLTSVVNLIYDDLRKDYSCAIVNGQVPHKERSAILQGFVEKDDPHIVICDPGVVAEGFNLSVATTVCWYGATDKTLLYLQGNARVVRPEQNLPTTIVQLASTAIEREIYKRTAENTSMQGLMLDMIRGSK